MAEHYQICPYTGLRSFTEDESLYFKGREEDIDLATGQLQRNKFLMITGASGDGKSSLVYAGVIPNARSGFLKSKYSNWCVAAMRPERDPFQNLCESLAKQLDIPIADTVKGELSHGFSALVDLYKNSKKYIDVQSAEWQAAEEKGKAALRREAANLIVLVDQFEEFFTNKENYRDGAPSRDANLVLNILLETARIALEEDLPIYVVFTMRSDYIGQCAAFRGLPEYIGFSQFFVPRLNRAQLQLVIEEPATLSGNCITRRLTERLIHDVTEGVDQLPILQHALNQIWVAANHGNAEMDLLHYSMVGGMSAQELPEDQVHVFEKWFNELSPEIKACYHRPSLQNVLDTHTNKLYEQAAGYYTAKTGRPISNEDAKRIIRNAFTCLTKIDQGRAVRNRMTLQEITNILSDPTYNAEAVGNLLDIFREPGNTFIHPFISEDNPEFTHLLPTRVLDITHESLIRNWQYLGQWAKEEFESHSISLDFEKQLERWVNSKRSNNFLLSIGPLTYFENWYNKARPNAWWIARYLPEENTREAKLTKANETLGNAKEFLGRSARSHVITRTLMRYGPKRVAAVIGILALITLTSFTVVNYFKKKNNYVLDSIQSQALQLVNNPRSNFGAKSEMLAENLRSGITTLNMMVNAVSDTIQKARVLNGISSLLVFEGKKEPRQEIFKAFAITDSLLETFSPLSGNAKSISKALNEINSFRVNLELAYYYNPDTAIANWRKRNAQRSARWASKILETQPANFDDMQNLTVALENGINYQAFSVEELKHLINLLSPFENGLQSGWLKSNFAKDKLLIRGSQPENYGFNYNSLYQQLAYLYAAVGNSARVLQCVDTLLANSQNNFQGDYASGLDNATNIAVVYFLNGTSDHLDSFVNGYCQKKKIDAQEFYAKTIGRTLPGMDVTSSMELFPFMTSIQNLNVQYCNRKMLTFLYHKYREAVESYKDEDMRNFYLAVSYKEEGILKSLSKEAPAAEELTTEQSFDKAMAFYRHIKAPYLQQSIRIRDASSADANAVPRKFLFVYPDLVTSFHPMEPRSFFSFYFSDRFIQYIIGHNLFSTFYPTSDELNYITLWLRDYNTKNIFPAAFVLLPASYEVLKNLEQEIDKRPDAKNIDFNWLHLYAGWKAQQLGKMDEMLSYYNKIDHNSIFNLLRSKDYIGFERDQSFRLIGWAMMGYIKTGHFDQAASLADMFKNPINRSSLFAFTASELLRQKIGSDVVNRLIDSARAEMNLVDNITSQQPNQRMLAYALVMQSPEKNFAEANALIKNLPVKFAAMESISRALSFHGKLYQSSSYMPRFISASDQDGFLTETLYGYLEGQDKSDSSWQEFNQSNRPLDIRYIRYIDENS